jgi:hypothetical protein
MVILRLKSSAQVLHTYKSVRIELAKLTRFRPQHPPMNVDGFLIITKVM